MEDCLFYALKDYSNSATDEIYNDFDGEYGYGWWFDVTGVDTAVDILREFYDGYYPKIRDLNTTQGW